MNAQPMVEDVKTLGDYLQGFKRRRVLLALVTLGVLAIAIGVALGLPAVYKSTATILIEQQEIPQDLVRTTVTSFADQRIQIISQRVMTNANLTQIIEKYGLYVDERAKTPMEVILANMRDDDIKMDLVSADVVDPRSGTPRKATIAFRLSYQSKNPELAQKVTNELVSLFLNENLKSRSETTQQTLTFLAEESKKMGEKVTSLEKALAEFKEKYVGNLPELFNLNMQLMDRTERDLLDVQREIQAAADRRIFLESQLATVDPMTDTRAGQTVLSPRDRLKLLRTQYLELVSKYSANHPDVMRMKKEMEGVATEASKQTARTELASQRDSLAADLAAAQKKYSSEHPDVKRLQRELASVEKQLQGAQTTPVAIVDDDKEESNPAYVQLKAQLESIDVETATNLAKKKELEAKLADLESKLTNAPQVEREYRMLTRDLEGATAKYQEITAKQQEAQLADALETEQKGERFTLIEPPLLPEQPASPNRPAIAFLGAVFSIAGGVGSAALADALDSGLYGARGVARVVGVPPLAIIPRIESPRDRRRRILRRLYLFLGIIALIAVALVLLHFFWRPLDVLYFRALNKFGY